MLIWAKCSPCAPEAERPTFCEDAHIPPLRRLLFHLAPLSLVTTLGRRSRQVAEVVALSSVLLVAGSAMPDAPNDDVITEVTEALEAGDSGALLDLAAQRVDLVLLDQSAQYSRGQAALVLRDFFRRFPPDRVTLSERSVSGDGRAAMGRYWSANSSGPFSLYIGFRVTLEEDWLLNEIRVERTSLQRTGSR